MPQYPAKGIGVSGLEAVEGLGDAGKYVAGRSCGVQGWDRGDR